MNAGPGSSSPPAPAAVRVEGLTKRFPGVVALDGVTFEVAPGSCHALCGENGAGKSTLGRILAGIHVADEGRILLDGQPARYHSPRGALAVGVALVHQEPALCPNLSVADNLCLADLPARGPFVARRRRDARARRLLDGVGASVDVSRPVGALTVSQQQMVQIAGALGSGARVVAFDEPTSSLTGHEALRLFEVIRGLQARGVTCLYVSHRLDEIFRLCDTVTVLRDGRHVATQATSTLDQAELVRLMIGRRLDQREPEHVRRPPGPELLRVAGLSSPAGFHGISFSVRAGEVLGLAGLVGAGRSELARALFGLDPDARGRVFVDGREVAIHPPAEAIRHGIGTVPEDRGRQGLVLSMSALENTTLPLLDRVARLGWIRRRPERALGRAQLEPLRVRSTALDAPAATLSGGNQQKVVLAKWLAASCRVLLLDEPTRGVDVGARAELHALIDTLAAHGTAIVLISSDLPEMLALATRILVLCDGRLAGELSRQEANEEALMRLMAGVRTA